jgi:hypothetical protein
MQLLRRASELPEFADQSSIVLTLISSSLFARLLVLGFS